MPGDVQPPSILLCTYPSTGEASFKKDLSAVAKMAALQRRRQQGPSLGNLFHYGQQKHRSSKNHL